MLVARRNFVLHQIYRVVQKNVDHRAVGEHNLSKLLLNSGFIIVECTLCLDKQWTPRTSSITALNYCFHYCNVQYFSINFKVIHKISRLLTYSMAICYWHHLHITVVWTINKSWFFTKEDEVLIKSFVTSYVFLKSEFLLICFRVHVCKISHKND